MNTTPSEADGLTDQHIKPLMKSQSSKSEEPFAGLTGKNRIDFTELDGRRYPNFVDEFWTAKQRQASSLHEITYRGCFKPQLPRFFVERCSSSGDWIYDPFSGRGTTVIESALLGRQIISNDVNPLSQILTRPRYFLPNPDELEERLAHIPYDPKVQAERDLSMFYHKNTEAELVSLRQYLRQKQSLDQFDELDAWIQMVATNRLSGHSPGFFSVYTLPPNLAVSPKNQIKINNKRKQKPDYRNVRQLIMRKSNSLMRGVTAETKAQLRCIGETAKFSHNDARNTPFIESETVQVTVTSPPFLNVIHYSQDNWLRCWFNQIDADSVTKRITMTPTVAAWSAIMQDVLVELFRITRPGGWVFFEVGEVRKGQIKLEEAIIPLGLKAGFACQGVLINTQSFTKTANIWGIRNNLKGTNTNRIVMLRKGPVSALA